MKYWEIVADKLRWLVVGLLRRYHAGWLALDRGCSQPSILAGKRCEKYNSDAGAWVRL